MWKVEHKKQDGSLLIGYEYTYDLLGRVVQSVERPRGDVTAYTYTPAGRLESEGRTGQVAYSRSYTYNPDGSRQSVYRDDALNGEHHDFYEYDAVSGRLRAVEDRVNPTPPYPRHEFVWNPEGTLARWETNQLNSYARVFGYDEEGRLTKIERDYGNGSLQLAYEYGYNSDGVRVLERKYITPQHWREYRLFVCGVGCGDDALSLYARESQNGQGLAWGRAEEYVPFPTGLMYRVPQSENEPSFTFVLFSIGNGYVVHYPDGQMIVSYHTDRDGMQVGGLALPVCAEKRDWTAGCVPLPLPDLPYLDNLVFYPDIPIGCRSVGYRIQQEVDEWHNKHFKPSFGFDKFKHCLATCLIGLDPDGGLLCAWSAVYYTERGLIGAFLGPFAPMQPGGEIDDEIANHAGRDCARKILRKRYGLVGSGIYTYRDNWSDCIDCCLSKNYHPGSPK
ncbi:MAG: hypothetical protein KatS3mg019_0029 [Fimbriimonadales bacterium]|nr:MAG: hypothetical protein KatS3mg019_0029 [Fimbriimonadales bacterium]